MSRSTKVALAFLSIVGIGAITVYSMACYEVMRIIPKTPECEQLEANDISLMTENQRESARQTGISAYDYKGMHYVDASLPSEYYGG